MRMRTYVDQVVGETVGGVVPVADMHQRKAEMARQSDAFVALPGEWSTSIAYINVTDRPAHGPPISSYLIFSKGRQWTCLEQAQQTT
jgi:predicted Rossmann-fold nucleotide-binding protein